MKMFMNKVYKNLNDQIQEYIHLKTSKPQVSNREETKNGFINYFYEL
jgi:hypothetical protein